MSRLRTAGLLLVAALVAAACSSEEPSPSATGPSEPGMAAIAVSSDLYVGEPQRVAFGLQMPDGSLVSFGTVDVAFSYVGDATGAVEPQPGPTARATFVPTFGTPDRASGPAVTAPSEGRGVYEASDVVFDRAGFWTAEVTAEVQGLGTRIAETTFAVLEEAGIPAPGDRALETENLTLDSKGVPPAAIDSRAATRGEVPDPVLHEWTIARAVAQGRPALVVFATPVYCVSKFCGPVTDMVEGLARRYEDRAVFIHVEIWKEFGDTQVLNDAATEWLLMPNGDLTEPWLFLVGADGRIVDRWSTLWSEAEVEAALEALPPMAGS